VPVAGLLPRQLVGEADHDAGEIRAPVAVGHDAGGALVIAPEPLRRLVEEGVDVLGDVQVVPGAADLEHAPALAGERAVDRDPDRLDEEVLAEDHRHQALVLADPSAGASEVRVGVVEGRARSGHVEVVLEHQPLRRRHRRFGLVPVGALGEGEKAGDAADDLVFFLVASGGGGRGGHPRRARIDPETRARVAERRAVRRLVALAENLVHVLVRHLVLQDLDYRAPRLLDDHGQRDLEGARRRDPAPQHGPLGAQLEGGGAHPRAKVRFVYVTPGRAQLPHQRRFERRGQLSAGSGRSRSHRAAIVSTRVCSRETWHTRS
jgi:hypothetical protein